MKRTLVIGYGNELRSDDAAGPRAARTVAEWGLPHVHALAVHQLTPELAELVAGVDQVVFVDAGSDVSAERIQTEVLHPQKSSGLLHASDPRSILALAAGLYGARPPAVLVRIPAESFEVGDTMSVKTQAQLRLAEEKLRSLCAN